MTHDMEHAFANGRGWYSTICELVAKLDREAMKDRVSELEDIGELTAEEQTELAELNKALEQDEDEVRREIEEGPLSVQVRDGWRSPGERSDEAPEEYEILLSTGGPALRIYGKMGQYHEPETAELQAQDWFTPWVCVPDCDEEILLAYARCFYFGG